MDKEITEWIVRGRTGEMPEQGRKRNWGWVYKASGTEDGLGRLGLAGDGG